MSANGDRIELELPHGKVIVRHARCPEGCDLMDPEVEIHGHAAIHLTCEHAGQKGAIHIDPVYGSYENRCTFDIPSGGIVQLYCPSCGTSLQDADASCSKCSAPMFTLHLPEGSFIEGCQRNGCPQHTLRIVTGEQLMQRLFDAEGMDAYL